MARTSSFQAQRCHNYMVMAYIVMARTNETRRKPRRCHGRALQTRRSALQRFPLYVRGVHACSRACLLSSPLSIAQVACQHMSAHMSAHVFAHMSAHMWRRYRADLAQKFAHILRRDNL